MKKHILLPVALCALNLAFSQEWPLLTDFPKICEPPFREYAEQKANTLGVIPDTIVQENTDEAIHNPEINTKVLCRLPYSVNPKSPAISTVLVFDEQTISAQDDITILKVVETTPAKNDQSDLIQAEELQILEIEISNKVDEADLSTVVLENVNPTRLLGEELIEAPILIDEEELVLINPIVDTPVEEEIVFICKLAVLDEELPLELINPIVQVPTETAAEFTPEIELTVFPNPTADWINLRFSGEENVQSIQILDANGKVAYSKEVSQADEDLRISMQDLSNGTYVLVVGNASKTYTKQVLVQHP